MPLIRFGMLHVLVAAILSMVALVHCLVELPWRHGPMEDDALKIAHHRYVRGEIGAEEFARLRGGLDGARKGPPAHRRITLRRQEP